MQKPPAGGTVLRGGGPTAVAPAPAGEIVAISMTDDGRHSLSAGGHTIRLWDHRAGKLEASVEVDGAISDARLSADGGYIVIACATGILTWWLDWEVEAREIADWDAGALPHLRLFLDRCRPFGGRALRQWETNAKREETGSIGTEEEVKRLLFSLQCVGYGWLRSEGVLRKLKTLAGLESAGDLRSDS